ncbi:hypothetical protein ACQKPX_17335 [Photobacterium sp. DNB23_23_1]
MKKMNSAYRLKIIKEVATRRRLTIGGDPMACHISRMIESNNQEPTIVDKHYTDCHYDDSAGGWVSNLWDQEK